MKEMEVKRKMNGWKITAIIFIILFVLETLAGLWIVSKGLDVVKKEDACSQVICGPDTYDAYWYDRAGEICYCYHDHELMYQEYLG